MGNAPNTVGKQGAAVVPIVCIAVSGVSKGRLFLSPLDTCEVRVVDWAEPLRSVHQSGSQVAEVARLLDVLQPPLLAEKPRRPRRLVAIVAQFSQQLQTCRCLERVIARSSAADHQKDNRD